MGVLDKFLDVMRLNPDEEEFFNEDYGFDDDEIEPEKPAKSSFKVKKEKETEFIEDYREKPAKTTSKVTPIRSVKKNVSNSNMELCVIKPTSMEDAKEITETLLDEHPVIINVEGLDVEIAQRITDFTSGSVYAINGKLQKISNYIIVVTPANVELSGDVLNLVDSFDIKGF